MVFNSAGQQVTCRDCGRTWMCTPEDDYLVAPGEGLPDSVTSGRCFGCALRARGLDPETIPVLVVDLTGAGTDIRDLSRLPAKTRRG
jgi:hypothetical protein